MGAAFSCKPVELTEAQKHMVVLGLLTSGRAHDAPQQVVTFGLNVPELLRLVSAVVIGKSEEIRVAVDVYLEANRHIVGAEGIGLAKKLTV